MPPTQGRKAPVWHAPTILFHESNRTVTVAPPRRGPAATPFYRAKLTVDHVGVDGRRRGRRSRCIQLEEVGDEHRHELMTIYSNSSRTASVSGFNTAFVIWGASAIN